MSKNLPGNKNNEGGGVFAISYKTNNTLKTRRVSPAESIKSAVDFEKAITETGYGKFNYLLLLLALPASCSSVFDSTSLSYALPVASCDLQLDAYDRGYLNGAIYAGMISSSFFWGFVSDKFGRQRIMMFGYLGDILFCVASSLSQDFWSLFIFKFLSGVMICGPFATFMSYLSELFNAKYRDSVVLLMGLFQAIGGISQPLLARAIIPQKFKWTLLDGAIVINSWRVFLLVCTLPSLISFIGTSFCHESPRFLLAKGRKDEALRVFRSIYSFNTGKPANTYSVKRLKNDSQSMQPTEKPTFWQEITAIFRPPHLHKALLIFSIQFGGLMTLNTIRLWLPQLFFYMRQMPGSDSLNTCEVLSMNQTVARVEDCDLMDIDTSVYTNMLYISLLTTACFSISTATVGIIGKRNLLVMLYLLQTAVVCSVGWLRPPFNMALLSAFVSFSNTTGFGLLSFVVQMFPTSLRTMGVSLTMACGRVGVCIGNAVLPFILTLSCTGTFVSIGLITLFCGLVLLVLASTSRSETAKNLDQTCKT